MIKQKKNKKFRPFYVKKRLSNGEIFTGFLLKATKTFTLANGDIVRKGERGGLVNSYKKLSQNGKWWIDSKSIVTNSCVSGNAIIVNSKILDSSIEDNAIVENSTITGSVVAGKGHCMGGFVSGAYSYIEGTIYESIVEDSKIEANAQIINKSKVLNATIGENSKTVKSNDAVTISHSVIEGGASVTGNTAIIDCKIYTPDEIRDVNIINIDIKTSDESTFVKELTEKVEQLVALP